MPHAPMGAKKGGKISVINPWMMRLTGLVENRDMKNA
jgi:hypothetical protein